jgi:hypothetical protein
MKFREKTESCSGCQFNDSLDHKLFHESGLSSGIIRELGFSTLEEIESGFRNSKYTSRCYISLEGRKTKVIDGDLYLMPERLINLIGNNSSD